MEQLQTETPSEASFRRLCQHLQSNNPAVVAVVPHRSLQFTDERAIALGEALLGNTFVEFLEVELSLLKNPASIDPLVNFVRHSPCLHFFRIQDEGPTSMRQSMVDNLLSAIALNSHKNGRTIQLSKIVVGQGCVRLLESNSVEDLSLVACQFMLEASVVANAFARNFSLQRLDITNLKNADMIVSILTSLKSPMLHVHVSLPTEEAARSLTNAIPTQMLTIQESLFTHESGMAVCKYLNRRRVKNVALLQCRWENDDARRVFLCRLVSLAETLMIHACGFDAGPIMQLVEEIQQCKMVSANLWPLLLPRLSKSARYVMLRTELPGLTIPRNRDNCIDRVEQ